MAFSMIREQSLACHQIGIGTALADLFARSAHRDFLLPFELALRAAALGGQLPMVGAPPETLALAQEVMGVLLDVASAG